MSHKDRASYIGGEFNRTQYDAIEIARLREQLQAARRENEVLRGTLERISTEASEPWVRDCAQRAIWTAPATRAALSAPASPAATVQGDDPYAAFDHVCKDCGETWRGVHRCPKGPPSRVSPELLVPPAPPTSARGIQCYCPDGAPEPVCDYCTGGR